MDNSFTEISIPEIITPDTSQGINNAPIEDVQMKLWNNRNISWVQFFAMDIWSSAGATWDATFRVLNLIGFQWDREKSYSQEIITALWSTTAKITKRFTIDTPVNNIISVPSGKVLEVVARFSSATQNLKINNTTWSYRFLEWSTNILTSSNPRVIIMNSWDDNLRINLQFATSASDRPIFWVFLKIY